MKTSILTPLTALMLMMMVLSGCGGGGTNPAVPPTVTVTPATANVQEGSTQQFTATVTNSNNTAVTWQVNGIAGGNSSVGTVSSGGLYTAPAIIPNPASVTVTAVLQANTGISGNSIVTVTAVQFNNSSLKGNYVLSVSGIDLGGATFQAVGTITADGNGKITGGEQDLNDVASGYFQASSITGTYTVGSDGRGTLTLNIAAISQTKFTYAFALRALNNAGLNEIDDNVINATGNLEQQTPTGVTTPSGNYAFGFNGTGPCGASNSIGIFSLTSGNVGGLQDLNCGGTITQSLALNGSYATIDGLGRGIGQFSNSTGNPHFVYYVVSANRYRFMCPDPNTFFLGSADLQTKSSFAGSDFNGSYVVSTGANTPAGVSYTLIYMNASGGNVSTGNYDVNDTGTIGQASLSGAYNLNSDGRINGSFTVNGVSLPFSMYLISPTQAYYLDQRTTVVGGGNVYAQASGVTTDAAWAGSYATKQFGYFISGGLVLPANASSVSGQISADGVGNLAGTLDFNDAAGIFQNYALQGTYSVGNVAPGRMTVTITTSEGKRTYVGYVVDQARVLLLETDANVVSSGDAIRQF